MLPNGISPEIVRAHLEKILASGRFARSESLGNFLRFVVEQSLNGRGEELKEYVVGVGAFHRNESYDPRIDPIVRVQAGKLRVKLREYYGTEGRNDGIRIELRRGSYAPVFARRETSQVRISKKTRIVLISAAAGAAVLAFIIIVFVPRLSRNSPELVLTRVTWETGLATDPAVSRDGNTIAYASDRAGQGNLDIWIQRGTEAVQLTNNPSDETEPSFSPDGSHIAFRRNRGGIAIIPISGGEERVVSRFGWRPRFSPDGQWIAFWLPRRAGEVQIVSAAGGQTPIRLQEKMLAAGYPVWTPDGKHVLFTGSRDVKDAYDWWVTSIDPAAEAVKTGVAGQFEAAGLKSVNTDAIVPGDWGGDGRRVLFSARRGDGEDLWEVRFSQAWKVEGPPRRLTSGANVAALPSVSGQGRLVFASLGWMSEMYAIPINESDGTPSGDPQRITQHSALESGPVLSADGKKLAFTSDRSGNGDIWIRDLKTGTETALTSARSYEFAPILSADGSAVIYNSDERREGALYRLTAGGTPEFLCDTCAPTDWSSDGKTILFMPAPPTPLRIGLFDVASRKKSELLRHPTNGVGSGRLSPDRRWINFLQIGGNKRRVTIAPFRDGKVSAENEWIEVVSDLTVNRAKWSPDGNMLYFTSEQDGSLCIWAQRLHPESKRPTGAPLGIYHSHSPVGSLKRTSEHGLGIAVAKGLLVFNVIQPTGSIWTSHLR